MFFGVNSKRKIPADRASYKSYFFRPVVSGINVNDTSAFTYSAFYSCVRIIAETIAYLPWHVIEQGTRNQVARGHWLDSLLYMRPNDEQNAFTFKELSLQHLLAWGNSYAEKEMTRTGEIVNLWPIDPAISQPDRDQKGRLYYEVQGVGAIPAKRIFHCRGPSRDGINGYSVIQLAKESIGMGLAAETFGAAFFGNGAFPASVITNDGSVDLDEDGVKNLLKTFNKKNKGAKNAMRTEYLEGGMDLKPVGIPPKDAQFLETRKFQISELCRWFRIPPHKLADLERATHNNIEAENIGFVTDTIMPWVARMENQANFSLVQEANRFYTKMNVLGLLRGDSKARSEYYKTLFNMGVLSINDIMAREDMDDLGPVGDLRMVPLNMTTLENAGKVDKSKEKAAGFIKGAIEETAQRFVKMELAKVKKLAESEKPDREKIAGFYIAHGKKMADGFNNQFEAYAQVTGREPGRIEKFIGEEIEKSANSLQNAIESGTVGDLIKSWESRKAGNMARDLVEFIGGNGRG